MTQLSNVHRRLFLAVFLLVPLAAASASESGTKGKPNIVLILADDMGYGDLTCYNSKSQIPTPNMDRLASKGIRLLDAHSPSAVCSPTRYALLTGRYAWRTRLTRGVLWGDSPCLIKPSRMTLASLLKSHGFATACIGKWHLGLQSDKTDYSLPLKPGPIELGFDTFFGIPATLDMEPYVYVLDHGLEKKPTEFTRGENLARAGGKGFHRPGRIAPGFSHVEVLPRTAEKAVEYIEKQGKEGSARPFFLYFALTAPHTPWVPSPEFIGKSKAGPYGDFVAQIDHIVGQVSDALDRTDQASNTLFIMTSDNGAHWMQEDQRKYPHLANGNLKGQKADIWEGGHRVPFIARWPGKIQPGTTSSETVCLTDLLATFAAILDTDLPSKAGEDSYNILPVLLGQKFEQPLREATVHQSFEGFLAIRQGDWKLIFGRGSGGFSDPAVIRPRPGEAPGQLYHLGLDPTEKDNVFLKETKTVKRLQLLMQKYIEDRRSCPAQSKGS